MTGAASAIEAAAFAALSAGVTLAPVHQHVPEGTPNPVVVIGSIELKRLGGKIAERDRQGMLTIGYLNEGEERKPLHAMQAEVEAALDGLVAEREGWTIEYSYEDDGDARDEENEQLYAGMSRFAVMALYEPPPPVFINGANTSITDVGDGWYRITKTGGVDGEPDAFTNQASPFQAAAGFRVLVRSQYAASEFFAQVGLDDAQLSSASFSAVVLPLALYGDGSGVLEAPAYNAAADQNSGEFFILRRSAGVTGASRNLGTETADGVQLGATVTFPVNAFVVVQLTTLNAYVDLKLIGG